MKQSITIELDIPEGWKKTDIRRPKKYEHYLASDGAIVVATSDRVFEYQIVERINSEGEA